MRPQPPGRDKREVAKAVAFGNESRMAVENEFPAFFLPLQRRDVEKRQPAFRRDPL